MLATQWLLLALLPLAYIIGSVPFGLIVGLWRGVDPRQSGSGNIGATNLGRLLGGKFFALVFVLDLFKGLIPMAAASLVVYRVRGSFGQTSSMDRPGQMQMLTYLLWLLVGFAAIAGHMFSIFIHFKGGKGVATSAGVVLGLFPYYTLPGLVVIAIWLVLFFARRYVSLASIAAAGAFPVAYVIIGWSCAWPILGTQIPLLVFAFLVAGMIIYKHRQNIRRLIAGTEQGFGPPPGATA